MIELMGRRLGLALGRATDQDPDLALPEAVIASGPVVEFLAYGDDCLLVGRYRLRGDRMTDQLNEDDEYEVVDLVAERLSDGHAAEIRRSSWRATSCCWSRPPVRVATPRAVIGRAPTR